MDSGIILPSKPKVIKEEGNLGIYEIENLYPGYGQTLGNSLRRVILSSLVGTAITSLKIDGVKHEFSTIPGIKEDVINLIFNLKQIRFRLNTNEPQTIKLKVKGPRVVTAADLELPGQVEVINPESIIANLADKNASLELELTIARGHGYLPKEVQTQDRGKEIGTIFLDATFTPIRRASYEVENMRVGDRTDYNRLRLQIETDGTIEPRRALERSVEIMIGQLKAVVGFREENEADNDLPPVGAAASNDSGTSVREAGPAKGATVSADDAKLKIEELGLSTRVVNALADGGVRTLGGLLRKKGDDLLAMGGLGDRAIREIKEILAKRGLALKE